LLEITCSRAIDAFVGDLRRPWALEFYGNPRIVQSLMHRSIACLSRKGRVAVALIQEFGGLDPYLIGRYARMLGSTTRNILVARAFKLESVPHLLSTLPEGTGHLVVVNPYLYAPDSPLDYHLLTPVSASIKKALDSGLNVLVFNTPTRYGGGYLPEGGNLHHHLLQVIVKVGRCRRTGILLETVKHAFRPPSRACVSFAEVGISWGGQRPLLEWLWRGS